MASSSSASVSYARSADDHAGVLQNARPDLVVEVMSPHPRIGRLGERLEWFGKYGVRECWLVHQFSSEIEVIAFSDGGVSERRVFATGEVLTSAVLPTFKVPVDSLV